MRSFRSDNNAGLCPEALQALVDANDGSHRIGYGDDALTAQASEAFRTIFGPETGVWFVSTGTAANTLAIAALTEPWEQVVCHSHSHYNDDESTAPERITHCRTTRVVTEDGKLTVAGIEQIGSGKRGDVHEPQPGVVTLSNPTEFGTVYTPDETRELCGAAHHHGYRVHVDGARFANAVASLACTPRELSVDAGVDALSFGGTKNGLAFGEAVLFFPQGDGHSYTRAMHAFPFHRKGTGHLLSKHRFVSAPFAATLSDDVWLKYAGHANGMARHLADGLARLGITPRFPVQANGVFVSFPEAVDRTLQQAGYGYYPFGDADWRLSRLMCSFDTSESDVDALLADVATALSE